MAKYKGFFKVERAFLDSDLWLSEPFTRAQAWLDLIGLANYEAREVWEGAQCLKIPRGSLFTTLSRLSARWRWSKKKTMRFLNELENAGMCTTKGNAKGTAITIENYNKFQLRGNANDTEEETLGKRSGNARELSSIIERNKEIKNIKNMERENDDISEDPRVIGEFVDPRTGEERIIIRP